MSLATESPSETGMAPPSSTWTWLALALALALVAGSLFLSLGMGLKACPLCYYQRTFAMGVLGVLAIGVLTGAHRSTNLALLALPAAFAALAVAIFHVTKEQQGAMECPAGVGGIGTAPQQSLAGGGLLTLLLVAAALRDGPSMTGRGIGLVGGALLGLLLAFAAVQSTSPTRPPSDDDYQKPPDICRPIRSASSGR
jgi:disulfide bond formation protein DsbB